MKSTQVFLIAAPLCFFGYGVIRFAGRLDHVYGPGLDWQAAHLVNLVGLVLFVPAVFGLRRMLPAGWGREAAVALTLIGVATSIVQFVADIVFGLLADDKAGMRELSGQFSSVPGVRLTFYTVGPPLMYVGIVALVVMLARIGKLPWWSTAVVTAGVVLPLITLDLIPVAALCFLAGLAPLALRDTNQLAGVTR
ncbi:MAG: hypothetical protein ACRDT4_02240 [Micromonosporaceae bacterium]